MSASRPAQLGVLDDVDAVILDMDGVLTDTASLHALAWKRLFDDFLRRRAEQTGEPFQPFDLDRDYRRYVDGKRRMDGVRSFLASRGIHLPEGVPGASPAEETTEQPVEETVEGLGMRKDAYFLEALEREGARPYLRTVDFVRALRARGMPLAVISASRNCRRVLASAGLLDLFDARVDGVTAADLGLPGKPDPAIFLEAARRLGAAPARTVVIEDALAGVEAGRRGGFALVVGVDRTGHPADLEAAGAHLVVRDPADLLPGPDARDLRDLPDALERVEEVLGWFGRRRPVFFLDFDGTLSPIVDRPEDATIDEATRAAVRALAEQFPVAVLSGRDRADVVGRVGLDGLVYAGSHGFDVSGPGGMRYEYQEALPYLDELDRLERELTQEVEGIAGAIVDRKRFALALHDRQVAEADRPRVEQAASEAAHRHPGLHASRGKRVYEFRPDVPWDKGRALLWLLDALGLERPRVTAMYLGDDTTDEDAFLALRETGIGFGVIVGDEPRNTAAHYRVTDPRAARDLLVQLAARLAERRRREDR